MNSTPSTYQTLDGEILDLTRLSPGELKYFNECYHLFAKRGDWGQLSDLVRGPTNPLLGPGRRITREVANHALYKAVRDLEDRLGILTGNLGAEPGDDPTADPLSDSLLSVAEAAALKGTTPTAVRKAIARGELIMKPTRPQRVSERSLQLWTVNPVRQRARQGSATVPA